MSLKNSESMKTLLFFLIMLLIAAAFSFSLFGMVGARVVLGIVFVSSPFYFILSNFELSEGEKFVFSALMGLTIFPSLAYALGLIISFRAGIVVVFVALIGAGVLVRGYKKRKGNDMSGGRNSTSPVG